MELIQYNKKSINTTLSLASQVSHIYKINLDNK